MVTSQTRFTLQDDVSSSSFLVMITELKAGDAGTYWCGSDSQWTTANYTKIHLSVGKVIKRAADGEYSSISDSKNELYIFSLFCFQMQPSFTLWFSLCPLCCSYW
uniref:Immunoglobulin V-set domain-containing protein n=1 Tax=Dicentrarchus labrax TaxID=13489 RepID=A0A8P4KCV1_DICLA